MWRSFSRSQLTALIATSVDYSILLSCVEFFHWFYPFGVALGCLFGGATSFLVNRHWSFESNKEVWHAQARRYVVVGIGSMLLNTAGVYLVTEFGEVHYFISQIVISISVGFFYNYPLHRFFVYKERPAL